MLKTIEYQHPSFATPIRYVKNGEDITARIETGEMVWFKAGNFEEQMPEKGGSGTEALNIVAPNSDQSLIDAVEAAKYDESITPVICIYREYDFDDLSAPATRPIILTTTRCKVSVASISLTASWRDLTNRRFLRRQYTTKTHPGLAYL
ncbi:TPA: DUF1833 family protein [Vibrio cholerae]|nr:DUF1833 family protein [Vibrio cholerae]